MTHSDQINELATAMAKAQAEITGAKRDSNNPFFHSKYADLASVWDACRAALTKNGLAVVQSPRVTVRGEPDIATRITKSGEERDVVRALTELSVTTTLMHSSGQWVTDEMSCLLPTPDPQAIGSGTTYLRRYALSAFVGVAPEDDDGNAAAGHTDAQPPSAMDVVTVKVLGIVQRPTAKSTRYMISADDGHAYATFKRSYAEAAKSAQEAGSRVTIAYKLTQFGRDVVTLTDADAPEPVL